MKKPERIRNQELLNDVRGRPCLICGQPSDPAHVRGRGAGGDDVATNVVPLCRLHHREQHQLGWSRFLDRHPSVEQRLHELGWVVENIFGVNKLVRR